MPHQHGRLANSRFFRKSTLPCLHHDDTRKNAEERRRQDEEGLQGDGAAKAARALLDHNRSFYRDAKDPKFGYGTGSFLQIPSFLPSFPLDPRCFGCFPSLVSSPRLPRESSLCAWFAMLMLLCRACAHRRRFAAATRETEWPKKAGARRRRRRGAPRTGARGRGREGGSACLVSSARARVEIPGEGIG